MPLLDLESSGQERRDSIRSDAPAMLNLEAINMSEEELIRSYDPDNEENNYHLPHHLYKKLQLERYRPVCSEVVKNALYIGSHQVSGNLDCLRRHGITHIVNAAADVCDNHFVGQFQYLTYYLKDANNEDISMLFYRTLRWVDEAIQRGAKVLVHCREGVSRSSTLIIAYLMWRYSIAFESAHERIRQVRPICNPNTGFTCQLLVLGKRLGLGGNCNPHPPPSDRPTVFRVAPYHPMEPFLLLYPAEWLPDTPNFDPRFGWVVQRGCEASLWIGAQVANAEATQSAARQHFSLIHDFEKIEVRLSVVQDGLESSQFWQLLGIAGPPNDRCQFTATRLCFDTDAEILGKQQGASVQPAVADDLDITSPRDDDSLSSSVISPTSPSSPSLEQSMEPPAQLPSAGPPRQVPSLALGGLRIGQPASIH
jgi:predicted protein tyrosine phosphatase